jgi:hypothetical protein
VPSAGFPLPPGPGVRLIFITCPGDSALRDSLLGSHSSVRDLLVILVHLLHVQGKPLLFRNGFETPPPRLHLDDLPFLADTCCLLPGSGFPLFLYERLETFLGMLCPLSLPNFRSLFHVSVDGYCLGESCLPDADLRSRLLALVTLSLCLAGSRLLAPGILMISFGFHRLPLFLGFDAIHSEFRFCSRYSLLF